MTMTEYLEQWLHDYAETHVARKTYERYAQLLRKHVIPRIGKIDLSKLKPTDITAMEAVMLKSGRCDGSGGLCPTTVVHAHKLLRKTLQDAVQWQMIGRNPADQVKPPRMARKAIKTLNREEIGRLITAAKETRFYMAILLAVSTGMRRGEIYGLRWEDVDFEHGTLCVQRSLEESKSNGLTLKETKSGKGRQIILPESVVEELILHRKAQDELKKQMGERYMESGLVVTRPDGNPKAPNDLSRRFCLILEKAKLPPITFHGLRHTHATILLQEGVHPKVVQERLGHSTISVTMDIYSHVTPSMQQDAARLVNGYLV